MAIISLTLRNNARNRLSRLAIVLAVAVLVCGPALAEPLPMLGWIEDVLITDKRLKTRAKVDTGADHSSLHALDIQVHADGDKRWVEFVLLDQAGQRHALKRPLLRMVKIKKKTSGHVVRPVVKLDICIGRQSHRISVNLTQRSSYLYPMLIGRSALAGKYIVDPGKQQLRPPVCRHEAAR